MLVTGVFIVQGGEISRWRFCSLVLVVNFLTKVLFTSYSEFFVNVDQSFWLAGVCSWCSVTSIYFYSLSIISVFFLFFFGIKFRLIGLNQAHEISEYIFH